MVSIVVRLQKQDATQAKCTLYQENTSGSLNKTVIPPYYMQFPAWYGASASPKHFPFSRRRWRTYASFRLKVFLHPPIMNNPLWTYTFSSRTDVLGTSHSSASMTGTPQHTQDASSSERVCVATCRLRSGERRFRWTWEQYGHFHRFVVIVAAISVVGVGLDEPRVGGGVGTWTLRRLLMTRRGRDRIGDGDGDGDRECEEWCGEVDERTECASPG